MWVFYDKDGNEVVSEYKALGATYAVEANGIFTLYVPNEKGEMQTIELPTAASMISALTPDLSGEDDVLNIQYFTFLPFQNVAADKKMPIRKHGKVLKQLLQINISFQVMNIWTFVLIR